MTESDLDEEAIVPEIVPENQLQTMVKDLEPSKANFFIEKFSDHVKMAAEWAKKAKNIIVTDENQIVLMKQAKVARLFLREKRLEIENTRKVLKADALKEGQAIDKISNFLKDLIIPTELHLERQEKFIEFKEEAERERIRLEVEAKMEEERIVKEKADAEEREILREENNKLRLKQQMADEVAQKLKEENDKILQEERNKALRIERELQISKQEELKKEADKIRAEERLRSASDVDKIKKFHDDLMAIEFPEVSSQLAKRIVFDSKTHVGIAVFSTKNYLESIIQQEE